MGKKGGNEVIGRCGVNVLLWINCATIRADYYSIGYMHKQMILDGATFYKQYNKTEKKIKISYN